MRAAVGEGALVQMATGMGKSDTIALVAKQMEKEGAVVHVATGMGKADTMALAAKQAEKEEPCTPRSEESWEDAAMCAQLREFGEVVLPAGRHAVTPTQPQAPPFGQT